MLSVICKLLIYLFIFMNVCYLEIATASINASPKRDFSKIQFVTGTHFVKAAELWKEYEKQTKTKHDNFKLIQLIDVDINNDHSIEHVFILAPIEAGPLGPFFLEVVQQLGSRLRNINWPGIPDREADVAHNQNKKDDLTWFKDSDTNRDQQLAQINGKTYMILDSGEYHGNHRDAYIWKGGKVDDACDDDYANYERSCFQAKYTSHLYHDAAEQLDFYLSKCKGKINSKLNPWLQNDLALAYIKTGQLERALQILNQLESNPQVQQGAPKLKKAVAFNKGLCMQQKTTQNNQEQPLGKNQYAWLLNYKSLDDKTFKANFLKLVLNTFSSGNHTIKAGGGNTIVNTDVYKKLSSPEITVDNNRFVWLSGDFNLTVEDMSSNNKMLIWVDTQEGTSLLVYFSAWENHYTLDITSKNFTFNNIPTKAREDIKNWVIGQLDEDQVKSKNTPLEVTMFHDLQGKKKKLSATWFDGNT